MTKPLDKRPRAYMEVKIYDPNADPDNGGLAYAITRMIPVQWLLENSTEHYNLIVAELGEMCWWMRREVGVIDAGY